MKNSSIFADVFLTISYLRHCTSTVFSSLGNSNKTEQQLREKYKPICYTVIISTDVLILKSLDTKITRLK